MNVSDEERLALIQLVKGAGKICDIDSLASDLKKDNWSIHPVTYQGYVIGGILQKEGELHTSIAPEYQKKWNPRPYINSILYPALEKYGEIKSLSEKSDIRCLKWLLKLGFNIVSEDENYFYLQLNHIKFR